MMQITQLNFIRMSLENAYDQQDTRLIMQLSRQIDEHAKEKAQQQLTLQCSVAG